MYRHRNNRSEFERMYGFFRCPNCRKQWESSHVYCTPGTQEAVYGQECKSCKIACKPFRVERLVCSQCGLTDCICTVKDRHIDPNKLHRSDLCEKCKAGHPCGK